MQHRRSLAVVISEKQPKTYRQTPFNTLSIKEVKEKIFNPVMDRENQNVVCLKSEIGTSF